MIFWMKAWLSVLHCQQKIGETWLVESIGFFSSVWRVDLLLYVPPVNWPFSNIATSNWLVASARNPVFQPFVLSWSSVLCSLAWGLFLIWFFMTVALFGCHLPSSTPFEPFESPFHCTGNSWAAVFMLWMAVSLFHLYCSVAICGVYSQHTHPPIQQITSCTL